MPMPRAKVQPKPCAACGKMMERKVWANGRLEATIHFKRRKFCDRRCMAMSFDERPVKMEPSWSTAHHHARKVCPPGPCVTCGATKAEVHHRDGDWRNNDPVNLQRLCRRCHQKVHGAHRGTNARSAKAQRTP